MLIVKKRKSLRSKDFEDGWWANSLPEEELYKYWILEPSINYKIQRNVLRREEIFMLLDNGVFSVSELTGNKNRERRGTKLII
jgi:hypothetical protein